MSPQAPFYLPIDELDTEALASTLGFESGSCLTHFRPVTDFGHADVPPGATGSPFLRLNLDHDHRRAVGRLCPNKRLLQLADRADSFADRAHALCVFGEID